MRRSIGVLCATLGVVLGGACAHRPAPAGSRDEAGAPSASDGAPSASDGGDADDAGDAGDAGAKEPVPRLERVDVGTSGLSAYLPKGFPAFTAQDSPDGSTVQSADMAVGRWSFACIGVRFKEPMAEGDDLEGVLTGYMDYLKTTFGITGAAGYGLGHRLDSEPEARGVIDFWVDKDGDHWAVKGWVTRTHLAFMAIYGPGDYPLHSVQELYLDGIRFAPAP